jgi:hypothetical protein
LLRKQLQFNVGFLKIWLLFDANFTATLWSNCDVLPISQACHVLNSKQQDWLNIQSGSGKLANSPLTPSSGHFCNRNLIHNLIRQFKFVNLMFQLKYQASAGHLLQHILSTNLGYMWAFNNFLEKVTLELLENALLIQFAHINESPEENSRLMRAKQKRNLALIRRALTIIPSHATAVRAKFPLVVNFSALSCDSCVRRSATNYISVFSVRAGPCARRGAPSAIHPIPSDSSPASTSLFCCCGGGGDRNTLAHSANVFMLSALLPCKNPTDRNSSLANKSQLSANVGQQKRLAACVGPEKQPTSGSIRRFLGMIYFVKRRRRCSVIGTDVKQMRLLELFYIRAPEQR